MSHYATKSREVLERGKEFPSKTTRKLDNVGQEGEQESCQAEAWKRETYVKSSRRADGDSFSLLALFSHFSFSSFLLCCLFSEKSLST